MSLEFSLLLDTTPPHTSFEMTIDDWAFSDLSDHPELVDLLLSDHGAEPVEESGAMGKSNTPLTCVEY